MINIECKMKMIGNWKRTGCMSFLKANPQEMILIPFAVEARQKRYAVGLVFKILFEVVPQ